MLFYNKRLKEHARSLRNNMTPAERLLWSAVRRKQLNGFQFYRQRIIGDFIVDFYCPGTKLIIELDGSQHYNDDGISTDRSRDIYFENVGLKVLRFSNKEVLVNLAGVVQRINENL